MTHNSSKSGLGHFLGRGCLGLLSIALTATVSVIVQRSFDWMTLTPQRPAIVPALPGSSEAITPEVPEANSQENGTRPPLPEPDHPSTDGSGSSVSPDPFSGIGTNGVDSETNSGTNSGADGVGVQIILDEPASGAADTETASDRSQSDPSPSRIMQQFWEKLNH
ncbi:hypothetical protein [Egbenema bharatensis]|uniref:hypothetical protein n=1 Tax=Egbenema bharatensis TaxID=3463334 RepID=UPI003A8C0C13